VNCVIRPMPGFKAFATTRGTLVGIDLMQTIPMRRLEDGAGQDLTAAQQFYSLVSYLPGRKLRDTLYARGAGARS
jgi:hypothetical protein